MALIQRDFRKDKPKPLRVRIVCSVYPVRNIGISRVNADHLFSNGVNILTILERPAIESQE